MSKSVQPFEDLTRCDCGVFITNRKHTQHLRTKLHTNRVANADSMIDCKCGLSYMKNKYSKYSHMRSKQHFRMLSLKECVSYPPNNQCASPVY